MLREINFKKSIRSEDIQFNFDELYGRVKRESLSVGGKGIMSGLELSLLGDYKINVSPGLFIDSKGEECVFDGEEHRIEDIEPIKRTTERLTVNEQGEITMPQAPYSSLYKKYLETDNLVDAIESNEFSIISMSNGASINPVSIKGNIVTVDADMWKGRIVQIEYLYTKNRLDTVIINKQGAHIVHGIISSSITTSRDEETEGEYNDYFVLGHVETSISEKGTELIIHQSDRDERAIYVDSNNNLYLNGRPYRRIFFEKPDDPQVHDLYIDIEKAQVWAYSNTIFGFEWVLVNTVDSSMRRECKIYSPDEMPEDMQTFLFDDEISSNLFFTPNKNQVEVIIDNTPLMSDQFEEIIYKTSDVNSGRGIKLKDPLDKESYVEVRVLNSIINAPLTKAYQRTATFIKESVNYKFDDNPRQIFEAPIEYSAGEHQLELFIDGGRLIEGVDFIETDGEGSPAEIGLYKHFIVKKEMANNQMVVAKVTRNIYSYDHIAEILDKTIEKIEETAAKAELLHESTSNEIKEMKETFEAERVLWNRKIKEMEESIQTMQQTISKMNEYVKKTDKIELAQAGDTLKEKLTSGLISQLIPCQEFYELKNIDENDFLVATLISEEGSRTLIRDTDYSILKTAGKVSIQVDEEVVDPLASIYLSGVRVGN